MPELIWDAKYQDGKRAGPVRIALPFQTVETVNESAQDRQRSLELFSSGREGEWRNRLIWGDKKYVLPSLLAEFAGQVDLIYIDPPFDTGADFSFTATIPDHPDTPEDETAMFTKEPSILEQKAYRDTWGVSREDRERGVTHLDRYLRWFYETAALAHELLADSGSIYVHLDWHVGHYAKLVLDDVFGSENFINDITWYYYNKFAPESRCFPRASDKIMAFAKSFGSHIFNKQEEARDRPVRQLKRKFIDGKAINVRDEQGRVQYQDKTTRRVDDVWRISMLQPADRSENLSFPTQKPEALLNRILRAASNEGDLVLDCFAGSGTTAAVAEKLGRRWIACDLGRFAVHTTRKRLLSIPNVRPFVVQNLGKYERQAWQAAEFPNPDDQRAREAAYRNFILDLHRATPITGRSWLHGTKSGRFVHVGAVDAPVTLADVKAVAAEVWKAAGSAKGEAQMAAVDILGWEFAFELNETAKDVAAQARVDITFRKIPREVLEKKAVEQGDIRFFELAALAVNVKQKKREVTLELKDFVIPPDDIPEEVRGAIKHWSQWIDYWAVDWDYKADTFHNQWQSYRTRKDPSLETKISYAYGEPGRYTALVKVIDILGNDTTKTLEVEVR